MVLNRLTQQAELSECFVENLYPLTPLLNFHNSVQPPQLPGMNTANFILGS